MLLLVYPIYENVQQRLVRVAVEEVPSDSLEPQPAEDDVRTMGDAAAKPFAVDLEQVGGERNGVDTLQALYPLRDDTSHCDWDIGTMLAELVIPFEIAFQPVADRLEQLQLAFDCIRFHRQWRSDEIGVELVVDGLMV